MKKHHGIRQAAATVFIAAVLMVGCSDDPEALVASAKALLAKKDNSAAIIQLKNALQKDPDIAEARFLLGKALLDSGDALGAEKELRMARELQHPPQDVAPPFARSLVRLGRYKDVIDELSGVEIEAPLGKAELMTAVGQAHLGLGNAAAARAAFTTALAAQPEYVPAHLGQARLGAITGDFPQALAAVDSALRILPGDADTWQLKGDILRAQEQPAQALAAYGKAAQAKPAFVAAHSAMVSMLLQQKKPEDAAKQVEVMKQVAPTHPDTLYLQALMAYRAGNFSGARERIQQHLRAAPDSLLGLMLAGSIELELKAYAQAEGHLLKALQLAPRLRLARSTLIVTYLRKREVGKALDALMPVLEHIGKDAGMLALAGEVFMMNGDITRGAEYFAKAAALDPGDATKQTAVAMSHMATGKFDRGMRELEPVAAGDSGIRADLALIAGHMQRRQYDKALAAIAALEKKEPRSPLAHDLRGGALLGKLDPEGARLSFERALELDPTYFPSAANLAQLDMADRKPDAARQRYERVIAKDPKNVQALLALAAFRMRVAGDAGTPAAPGGAKRPDPEVPALIGKAISAQPTNPAPRMALMGYYFSLNDVKQAVGAAQEALAALPDRPEILEHAGRIYQAAGNTYQALTIYKKLASLQPKSALPYLRIAEVQTAEKNNDEAVASLQKALALKPDLLEAQLRLIALHAQAGRSKEAISVAREVQKQRAKESTGYVFEGDVYASQNKWTEAVAAYRAGLKQVSSTDLAVRLHAALAAGDAAEAERFAAAWLKNRPSDPTFRLYLAQAASVKKDYPGAAQQYRKLLESEPNNAIVLNNLAWIERQLDDPRALEHAEQANKIAPDQPAILDTLGVLLVEKGDHARGVQLLQKASALAPQAASIRLNLARALIKTGQKDAARRELDELDKLGDKFSGQSEVAQLRKAL
jgi:putative PEP-CTERM system TPR-repeat lipoprotein